MRSILFLILFLATGFSALAQQKDKNSVQVIADSFRIVEAACGQCKFGLKGKGCNLAIRYEGNGYFVEGSKIDDHGDAHADDGFCNKIRQAKVSGSILKNRFVATSFKLLPEEKGKP